MTRASAREAARLREQLRRAEDLLAASQAHARVGALEHDLGTGTVHWTPQLVRLLEIPLPGPRPGADSLLAYMAPESRPIFEQALRREEEGGAAHDLELVMVTARGRRFWAHTRGTLQHGDGRLRRRIVTVRDITLQKTSQQAQRQAWTLQKRTAEQLDLALRGGKLALWVFEVPTGRIRHAQRWEQFGYQRIPATVAEWEKLVHPDDVERRRERLAQCIAGTSDEHEVEFRLRKACGEWIWVRSRGHVVRSARRDEPLQYAGVVMDISGEIAARETQSRFERVLIAELEAQQAHIACELHDSLGSELAGLSLVLGGAWQLASEDAPDAADCIEMAQRQVKTAAELMRGLAHGLAPVDQAPGALRGALERLAEDLTATRGVRCDFVARGDIDEFPLETGTHLFRIAQEAIANAVRHGGAQRVQLRLTTCEGRHRLLVRDDGRGFDPATVQPGRAGLGMRSMLARARAFDAHVRFVPGRSRGTEVHVSWGARRYVQLPSAAANNADRRRAHAPIT